MTEMCTLTVLEAMFEGSCAAGCTSSEDTRGFSLCLFLFLRAPGIPWCLVASLSSQPLSWVATFLCLCVLSLYQRIVIGFREPLIQNDLILITVFLWNQIAKKTWFPNGVRVWGSGWIWVLGLPFNSSMGTTLKLLPPCVLWIDGQFQVNPFSSSAILLSCDGITSYERNFLQCTPPFVSRIDFLKQCKFLNST